MQEVPIFSQETTNSAKEYAQFVSLASLYGEDPSLVKDFLSLLLKREIYFLASHDSGEKEYFLLCNRDTEGGLVYKTFTSSEIGDQHAERTTFKGNKVLTDSMPARSFFEIIKESAEDCCVALIYNGNEKPIILSKALIQSIFQPLHSGYAEINPKALSDIDIEDEAYSLFKQTIARFQDVTAARLSIVNNPDSHTLLLSYVADNFDEEGLLLDCIAKIAINFNIACDCVGLSRFHSSDFEQFERLTTRALVIK